MLLHAPVRREAPAPAPRASAGPPILEVLERVLQSRKVAPPPGSYVAGLFEKGEAQICRKIGEEAIEVVTAALGGEGDERLVSEVADLWFHSMVLLAGRGIPLRRVFAELARRHAASGRAAGDERRAHVRGERARRPRRLALAGCSASHVENGTFYSAKGYQVDAPPGMGGGSSRRETPISSSGGPSPPGGMLADATCAGKTPGYPLPVLARHLTFGLTKRVTVERDDARS